jgi:hypothetical protein
MTSDTSPADGAAPKGLPSHISYSQWSSYSQCPRQWYLARLKGGEGKQSWYTPIGTVVHEGVEARLQGRDFDLTNRFYDLISNQMRIEPDLSKWLAGGPEHAPIVGDLALERAKACLDKGIEYLDEVDVWEVEYDASGRLPGLEVECKAFIDILGEHKKHGPVIWDWKTGSTKPGNFQLETYAALLKARFDPGFKDYDWKGRYVMLAPGSPNTRHIEFKLTPEEVGRKYQQVYDQMKAKVYKAEAGFNCRFCFQAENCLANKGMTKRAMYYDRSADDGFPF